MKQEEYKIKMAIDLPSNWTIEPEKIDDLIEAKERKTFEFKFSVPSETVPGTYMIRIFFTFDGAEIIKEYIVIVQEFIY